MSIKELILKSKGLWIVTLQDRSKWILDINSMMFDNYNWYKVCGTLEYELIDIDQFMKGSWKRIK